MNEKIKCAHTYHNLYSMLCYPPCRLGAGGWHALRISKLPLKAYRLLSVAKSYSSFGGDNRKKHACAALGPTAALRLFNENTLILDAGNYRLIELDPSGNILHECTYYTPKMEKTFRVVSPIKMIRLINKDVLIMDEDKMLQIMLSGQKLVWHSKIEDLAFQPKVDAPEVVVDADGNERLVYKVVDHGEIRPVRLAQKINFKRMIRAEHPFQTRNSSRKYTSNA